MSSINTSNSLGFNTMQHAGKRPTDPNANPLQDAHPDQPGTERRPAQIGSKPVSQSSILSATHKPDHSNESGAVLAPNQAQIKAIDTAEKLVSTTLIKPILAQARAARDAPAPWGQTQAAKQFGSLLDNRIADDIAKASNFPIAQRIAAQILKNNPVLDQTETYNPVDIFG